MRPMEATNDPYRGGLCVADRAGFLAETDRKAMLAQPRRPWWRELYAQATHYAGSFVANRHAVLAMRMLLSCLFLLSAGGKLVDIKQYSISPVMEFGILPNWAAPIFGSLLPFVELFCALGLLFGVLTRLSSFGLVIMSATFFFAKAFLLLQGYDLACGCFGAIVTTLMSFSIYLDPPVFLMALAIMIAPSSARNWGPLGSRVGRRWKEGLNRIWPRSERSSQAGAPRSFEVSHSSVPTEQAA